MFRISSFTFLLFISFGISSFYFPLYFQYKGLSNSEIGLVMGLGSAISIFAQPFWGVVSDRFQTVKKVLLTLNITAMALSVPLLLSNDLGQILFVMAVYMFFYSAAGPMSESLMIKYAFANNRNFGSIRLWGEIGAGTASIGVGLLTDQIGIAYLGWMYLASMLFNIIALGTLSDAKAHAIPVTKESLVRLFTNRRFLLFLGLCMLISVPHRMNDTFLTIYMQHLGGGESQIGVAWLIATLSGVPTMALAGRLFRKFNEIVLLSAAGAFYSVRWIVFHFAESPAAIFAGQMMQALTFPIVLMAAVHFIHLHVPHELKATGQTLFTACFSGIGGIIGSVAGGWLMDSFAPQTPYLIGIVFALCASVLIFAFRSFLVKKEDYAAGASGAP